MGTVFNGEAFAKGQQQTLQHEMVIAAEPLIKQAMKDIEAALRARARVGAGALHLRRAVANGVCEGADGLVCVDGWLYVQFDLMIFTTNRRCPRCEKLRDPHAWYLIDADLQWYEQSG
jgi:hypothetical protein